MSRDLLPTDLATDLASHPWVARVDGGRDGLRVAVDPAALVTVPEPGGLLTEHLGQWAEVYDWTYREPGADPALDLAGWRATGTGAALSADHMAEWADRTAELVLATRPRAVLELGCGTGMLLHRLAPHVERYVGTDVATAVLERHAALGLPHVTLVEAAAHEWAPVREALGTTVPDAVVINSVTQCFPGTGYLAAVLRPAVALVTEGGTVVVGDVRHAGLHLAHCRDLERAADPSAPADELDTRAARRAAADRELLLDPATVATAALGAGRPVRIATHAKILAADSELARYRVDIVLHVGGGGAAEVPVQPWDGVEAARALVVAGPVRITSIPNALLRPGGITPHQLAAAVPGDRMVGIDHADPTLLTLVAPASAAPVAAEPLAGLGTPHEPLPEFARTRVGELVRRAARRAGTGAPAVTVRLPAGTAEAGAAHQAGLAVLDPAARERATTGTAIPDAVRTLDRVALATMERTLTWAPGGTVADLVPGLAPRHSWIVRRWVAVLAEEGRCVLDASGRARRAAPASATPADDTLDSACAILGYPAEMAAFFRAAAAHLPRLLRDELDLQALLFPDGEILTALGTYQRNLVNTYLNGALAHLAGAVAATRAAPLRVLELGAGVGGSTSAVLDGLRGAEHDYLFTDVSRFFTDAAARRFPSVRTELVDVNTDLAGHRGRYDLIIAANVLHNAVHVRRTLGRVAALLTPGGVLAIIESTYEHRQAMTSMQFLMSPRPGAPHPGTDDVRAGTDRIFLDAQQWRTECAAAGLWPAFDLPGEDLPLAAAGQRLFVATR